MKLAAVTTKSVTAFMGYMKGFLKVVSSLSEREYCYQLGQTDTALNCTYDCEYHSK